MRKLFVFFSIMLCSVLFFGCAKSDDINTDLNGSSQSEVYENTEEKITEPDTVKKEWTLQKMEYAFQNTFSQSKLER